MNVDELLRAHAPSESAMRHEADQLRETVLEAATSGTGDIYGLAAVRIPRRRRRALARVIAAAAVLGIVATGLTITLDGGSPASAAQQRFTNAAAAPAYGTYGAFSAGNTVYIGNHRVTFDEKIKAMYYTSAGVLVRMGKVAYTDAAGPSHYMLIRPDGSHTSIDLKMGDRVPATDPDSPNVAYAEPTGDHWSYVVINLVTGKEVARTEVTGKFTWGGWEAPPVTMAGHQMWGLFDDGWREYDWQTGKIRLVPGTKGAPLEAAHGRFADFKNFRSDWKISDLGTGQIIRTVPSSELRHGAAISPNGRFLRLASHFTVTDERGKVIRTPGPFRFVDIDSGKVVDLDQPGPMGWTPGGNTVEVDAKGDRLTVCDPGTGKCDRIDLKIGSGKLKLGGLPYES